MYTHLSLRSIARTPRPYVRLAMVVFVAVVLVVLVNGFKNTTIDTLRADAEARSFWRNIIATPATGNLPEVRDALEASSSIDAVRYMYTELSTSNAALPVVSVAIVESPLSVPTDALINGTFPSIEGEVAVSATVAYGLDLDIGSELSVGDQSEATVVGIFPTLADRDELAAVWLSDPSGFEDLPVVYYADGAAFDEVYAAFEPFFDPQDRLFEVRGTASHFDDDPFRSNARMVAGFLSGSAAPVAILLSALLFGSAVSFLRSRQGDMDSLVACGMSHVHARRLFEGSAFGVMLAAMLAAGLGGALLLHLARSQLSALVGQNWVEISYSRELIPLIALLAIAMPTAFRYFQRDKKRISRSDIVLNPVHGVMVLSAGSGIAIWRSLSDSLVGIAELGLAVLCIFAISLGVPSIVRLVFQSRGIGETSLRLRSGPLGSSTTYAACLLAMTSVLVGGVISWEVQPLSAFTALPESSLALEAVRLDDAEYLASLYNNLEADVSAIVLPYPSERPGETMFRLTNGGSSSCLESTGNIDSLCILHLSTLAQNATGADPSTFWRISPHLDDGTGEIIVVEYDPSTGEVINSESGIATVDSNLLGTYGIGAVAPTGITFTDSSDVAHMLFTGFANLDLGTQAEFRRQIFSRAGYSQSAAAETEDYGLLALSWALTGLGLGFSALLLMRWSDQVWRDETSVPRLLNSMGGKRAAPARRLIRAFSLPQVIAVILSSLLAPLIGTAFIGIPPASFLPYLTMAFFILVPTAVISYVLITRAVDHEARS